MINQVAYDFESIRIDAGGMEFTGCTGISYSDKIEGSEKIRGNARAAYDATEGFYEAEDGELTMELWQYQNFIEHMGPGYMRKKARFDISVSAGHEGEPLITDTLKGCRVLGQGKEFAQGDVPMVTVPIQIMSILHNAIDPMADA